MIPTNLPKPFLIGAAWTVVNIIIFVFSDDMFWILFVINYFVLVFLLVILIINKRRFRIFYSLSLGAILLIPAMIIIGLFSLSENDPSYNYYSDEFYEREFSNVAELKLSSRSKIISKSDSIYGRVWGDYEHKLYCVMELTNKDREDLLKKLRAKKYDVQDTLSGDEFNDSFFMVPENNPLIGLKANSFRETYFITSKENFQNNYIISFHKNGKIVLFILTHV